MTTSNLDLLNNFRTAEGKAPFADWRKTRHLPMLEAYLAKDAADRMTPEALDDAINTLGGAIDAPTTEDAPVVETKDDDARLPTYKELAVNNYGDSTIEKPVAFIHAYCAEHPTLTRKETIAALLTFGINYSTARTQYQRWFAARKEA